MIINYSDEEVKKGEKAIFLAGPTPRDNSVTSWRIEVCKKLEKKGFDGIIYDPEYSTQKPRGDYNDQVEWEREALSNASVILFWIPRELEKMPAFTTNVEFGYWIHTGKIIYGRPDSAPKNKYLDWLYEKDMKEKPYNNLEELLDATIKLINQKGINHNNEVLPLKDRRIMK